MLTSEDFRRWGTTVLGLVIVAGDFVLYGLHVWQGANEEMGWSEWAGFFVMLSAGMLLLGYKFNPADFVPTFLRRK